MSAAARAEARRKAILSRGSDRLAKLTTSARGEDHPVYMHDDPPLPSLGKTTVETFVGEETIMPTPPLSGQPSRRSPAPSIHSFAPGDGPTAWSPEQQQNFVRAFMAGNLPGASQPHNSEHNSSEGIGSASQSLPVDDPMAAMMSALSQFSGQPSQGDNNNSISGQNIEVLRPKTRLQKLMPLVHLLATWCLLVYFVVFREPEAYDDEVHTATRLGIWQRWADLGWHNVKDGLGLQTVPFFWAFTTLQLVLHSVQIFSKTNPVRLPTVIAMALPYIPPPFPSLVVNTMRYVRMVGMLLDDISGLVVGVGLLISVASWLAT